MFIVTVGTPINRQGKPDLTQLQSVGKALAKILQRGDLVMLRSTVPAGTTRDYFIPLLESQSALRAGSDFNVAFAPSAQ